MSEAKGGRVCVSAAQRDVQRAAQTVQMRLKQTVSEAAVTMAMLCILSSMMGTVEMSVGHW